MRLLLLRISCFHLARVSAWFFTAVSMNCSSYWGTRWCHIIKPKTYSDRRYIQLVMVVAIYVAVQCCVCTHCTVSLYLAVNELSALYVNWLSVTVIISKVMQWLMFRAVLACADCLPVCFVNICGIFCRLADIVYIKDAVLYVYRRWLH